jgi:Flp pilus assembly protein TadD
MLGAIDQLKHQALLNPNDLRIGIDLYYALKSTQQIKEAQRQLTQLLTQDQAPAFLHHEQALLYAEQKDFQRAYQSMQTIINPTHSP